MNSTGRVDKRSREAKYNAQEMDEKREKRIYLGTMEHLLFLHLRETVDWIPLMYALAVLIDGRKVQKGTSISGCWFDLSRVLIILDYSLFRPVLPPVPIRCSAFQKYRYISAAQIFQRSHRKIHRSGNGEERQVT